MCFITDRSKIRLARKDIECYKNVHIRQNCCSCICRPFTYTYGITYSGKSKFRLFLKWIFNIYISYEAYHSYTTPEDTNVKCIIPKGSLFLINEEGTEYVSTSIKVLKPDWL